MLVNSSLVSYLSAWVWASRPFSLSAAIVPILVGSAIAAQTVTLDWALFSLALLGSLCVQIGTNLTDEYADHRRAGGQAKFPAPHKVLQRGLLSEREVLIGCFACFVMALGIGLYIVSQIGWPILVVGISSMFVAVFYSAGPKPLGDTGLGEITVFFFMGPLMVVASYYVQMQALAWPPFWGSLPIAFLVMAILHCNNLRDVEEDRRNGKRTFVSMLGPSFGRLIFIGMVSASYGCLITFSIMKVIPSWSLMGLLSLPSALVVTKMVLVGRERKAMSMALVGTAKLHGKAGILYSVGLATEAILN